MVLVLGLYFYFRYTTEIVENLFFSFRKMGDLDALVAEAKTKISELIAKPKMSEKLLSKPPFRFLHDTITSIANTTGFGEGLYSSEELDSAAITEKNAKIAYLDKIFLLVGICKVGFFERCYVAFSLMN